MITPVIHCKNWEQIDKNLKICEGSGIEMVWLINHSSGWGAVSELEHWYMDARGKYSKMKFGVNFLQLDTVDAIETGGEIGVDAIWTDYDKGCALPLSSMLLFGPVSFKYQKAVRDYELEKVCKEAMGKMNVITTSGPATGQPASLTKIQRIRSYIGDYPLAIASGISVENKAEFESYVDYMLVASSITGDDEVIIEDKLVKLLKS